MGIAQKVAVITGASRGIGAGLENGRIFVWNAQSGDKQYELEGHQDNVISLGFSHSGWLLGSRECQVPQRIELLLLKVGQKQHGPARPTVRINGVVA